MASVFDTAMAGYVYESCVNCQWSNHGVLPTQQCITCREVPDLKQPGMVGQSNFKLRTESTDAPPKGPLCSVCGEPVREEGLMHFKCWESKDPGAVQEVDLVSVEEEIAAMEVIVTAFQKLDHAAIRRVLTWAADRFIGCKEKP